MDFLKRLFRGGDELPETDRPGDLDQRPVESSPDAIAPVDRVESAAPAEAEAIGVKWRNIADDTGHSAYAGEVDGVRVATVIKHGTGSSGRGSWEWWLEVPTSGLRGGNSRILRDAKPAVEQALVGWQS